MKKKVNASVLVDSCVMDFSENGGVCIHACIIESIRFESRNITPVVVEPFTYCDCECQYPTGIESCSNLTTFLLEKLLAPGMACARVNGPIADRVALLSWHGTGHWSTGFP